MGEFVLPLDSTESHEWFDGLPDIARGYVQAAFFTGVDYGAGDGESVEIDDLGPANLDADGRAAMTADAVRFWLENAETLAQAETDSGYDLEQAGRDFWFTRNRHGVGFWDRGLGDVGETLTEAAQACGESDLYAEPRRPAILEAIADLYDDDPDRAALVRTADALAMLEALETLETGARLTTALEALQVGADADTIAETLEADGWTVSTCFRADPLTGPERAAARALEAGAEPRDIRAALEPVRAADSAFDVAQAAFRAAHDAGDIPADIRAARDSAFAVLERAELAALEPLATERPAEPLPHVGSRYGAPMGRDSYDMEPGEHLTARRVTLDAGGYDSGGAYWGVGQALWRVVGAEPNAPRYLRADTKPQAIAEVQA